MKGKRTWSLLIVSVLVLAVMVYGMDLGAAQEEDDWEVIVDEGDNYKHFRFVSGGMDDASFGVRWGASDDLGALGMFSVQNRHVAMTSVYDSDGEPISENKPISVRTVLAARLWRIFEYNDSNGNGLCDHIVDEDGNFVEFEEIYKYVDLSDADWEVSELIEEQVGENTTWEFTLSARDLQYYDASVLPIKQRHPDMVDERLEYVNLTFHLEAGTKYVEGASIPRFRVTVHRGVGPIQYLREVEREQEQEINGYVGSYEIKWDHEFAGWDYQPENVNPNLFMEFYNVVGNHIPADRPLWQQRFMHRIGEDLRATYNDETGERETNLTFVPPMRERRLHQRRISYGGNWSRAGRFHWVSDVTVDGEEMEMYAQIVRGAPILHRDIRGRNFVGFMVYGGFNYPGGRHIFHDPGIDGSAFLSIETEPTSRILPFRGLFAGILLVATVILVVLALLYRDTDQESVKSGHYDTAKGDKSDDWSDYYRRDRP